MDQTTEILARYVTALEYGQLSAGAIRAAKNCFIDSIGCAIGGYASQPALIARDLAGAASGTPPARLLGSGQATSMEMAAFANTVMIRYLDFNDTYISIGAGHPSDMLGAAMAVAGAQRSSGKDFLVAMIVAYEVFIELADLVPLRDRGWDQGVFVVLGSAAAAGKLLGLTMVQIGDALAIAASSSIPTRQTRSGELAMWKGCATAAAARSGVFAALLAQRGMTGPTAAFEGRHGLWEQVTGPFTPGAMGGKTRPYAVERAAIKFFPSEYHSQAPLWAALKLRQKIAIADIEAINLQTYYTAWSEIGSEPEKWQPKTRETADHSLPYLFAAALRDGEISGETFSEKNILDSGLRELMARIRITENKQFTGRYPKALTTEIEVITRSGDRLVERTNFPRGHAENPMDDADVESKFQTLCRGTVAPEAATGMLTAFRHLENFADFGDALATVKVA
jgi:2-methylcitrate dehydratase